VFYTLWERHQSLRWNAVCQSSLSLSINFFPDSRAHVNHSSLAYCELYVTLGTLFRRFEHMKANKLSPEDLVYDDYFSSYHPLEAEKFHVSGGNGS